MLDQWEMRIAAGRDAQTRSRLAFLATTVISVSLIITIFNFNFSWLHNFAWPESTHFTGVQEEVREGLRKAWLEGGRLNISLLGIQIAGYDATILGSLSLYILTLWFYYCIRRENHLIANLLIDAKQKDDQDTSLAVYHGIASYTVFTTIGGDAPIKAIDPPPPRANSVAKIRPVNALLMFLPAITVAFMIVTDIWTLAHASPARDSSDILWNLLSTGEKEQAAGIESCAIFLLLFITAACFAILQFEKSTESVLRQFHDLLFPVMAPPPNAAFT
jgi:hypothetical protein